MADYHLVVIMRSFNSVTFREYILLGDAKELEGKGIGVKNARILAKLCLQCV